MEEILTTQEAADYMGVSRSTIQLWINLHWLPARKVGPNWTIRKEDLDAFERRPVGRPKAS